MVSTDKQSHIIKFLKAYYDYITTLLYLSIIKKEEIMQDLKTAIRVHLAQYGQTYDDLAELVSAKTNKYCDKSLIAKVLNGTKSVPWVEAVLKELIT